MSYILDALRKAEHERQSKQSPDLHSLQSQAVSRHTAKQSNWQVYLLVIIVAVVASALMFWFLEYGFSRNVSSVIDGSAGTVVTTSNAVSSDVSKEASLAATENTVNAKPVNEAGPPSEASSVQPRQLIPRQQASPAARALIADLTFSFHVYSQQATKRAIIINGQRMKEGDAISQSLTLHSVTPTGIVIAFEKSLISVAILEQW